MKQMHPSSARGMTAEILAEVLGLDIAEIDARLPIQEVSTGLPFFIVPLNSLQHSRRPRSIWRSIIA